MKAHHLRHREVDEDALLSLSCRNAAGVVARWEGWSERARTRRCDLVVASSRGG